MSNMTNESDDAIFKNQSMSPSAGDSSSGGSRWEGTVLKKGPWTSAEDAILIDYVKKHGEGNWNAVQKHTGLSRCGKSCRLRWANHLRPNLKKGAFSQEEEQLIIELHAKMGNKWARMASHLPGRTDNEIKNYWNTRIKRRQRAGLPLYPPEMHVQRVQENQDHGKRGVIGVPKRHQEFFQASSYEQPIIPDCLKGPDGFPFAPDVPDWSTFDTLTKGASSLQCDTLEPPYTRCEKRYRESGALFPGCSSIVKDEYPSSDNLHDSAPQKISRSFGLSFICHPDHPMENQLSLDVISGSHALLNGNRPASKPTFEAVKLELPSFQYQETDSERWNTSSPSGFIDSVDAYIQSPAPTATVESCCVSPHDSGLLDMMLHEARIRSGAKKEIKPVEKCSDSTAPGGIADCVYMGVFEPKPKDAYHPFRSLVHSESLIFSECTETHGAGSSPDGSTSVAETYPGANLKQEPVDQSWTLTIEKDLAPELDITRPDVMLASSWLGQGASLVKETTTMSETLAALLGDDLGTEYMHIAAGTSSNQGRGFGSCAWNNMPPVCQMAELP